MTVALFREEKLYVVPETTYGAAAAAAAATNALRFLEANFTQQIDRADRMDKRGTRSLMQLIQMRKAVEWSVSGYLLPSGAAGTAPDGWDDILEAAFGTETINASTSVVYTLAKEFSKSLTFHRAFGQAAASSIAAEMILGAVVNQITISLSGTDAAKISASGFASEVLRAGVGTIATDSGTDIVFNETDRAKAFDVGMYINVDTITDQVISAVTEGSNQITVPSHTAQSEDELVVPSVCALAQTFTSTATVIAGILGSMSLDSASFNILAAEVTLINNARAHNDRYGAAKTTDFHQENRQVQGSITVRLSDTNFQDLARTKNNETRDLQLVAGTAAGKIVTLDLNQVTFDYSAIPSGGAEGDVIVTIPFKALGSSGEDEFSMTLT